MEATLNLPSQAKRIGQHEYRVTMLPLGRWLELQSLTFKLFGPMLAELVGQVKNAKDLGDLELGGLGKAVEGFASVATPGELERLLSLLGDATQVDGTSLSIQLQRTWWPRFMRELVPFIKFGLEVQLSDFFGGLADEFGLVRGQASEPGAPRSPST